MWSSRLGDGPDSVAKGSAAYRTRANEQGNLFSNTPELSPLDLEVRLQARQVRLHELTVERRPFQMRHRRVPGLKSGRIPSSLEVED